MRTSWSGWPIFAFVTGCGGSQPAEPPSSVPHALAGRPAPDLQRAAVDGSKVDTQALRGHVVVVKFFADYCEPCKRTLPAVERVHRDRPDVAFIGVDEDESEERVRALIGRYGLSFPIVHDRSNVLSGRFRVSQMPTTFVIGRGGNVSWVGGERQTENDLEIAIEHAAREEHRGRR